MMQGKNILIGVCGGIASYKACELARMFVRNTKGEMIQLSNIVSIAETVAPKDLRRFNQLRSVTIQANVAPGYTLGQALPGDRMALELMGSDEAGQERAGKFELAHGGTLVLEQVECLSLPMQAALLQLLKTGRIQRFDSARILPLRVRIIATSSAPLEQRVQERGFGRQLLYALQGCELWLPSLRERSADLPGLIRQHLAVQGGEPGRQFTPDALDCLLAYPWPGNLGELRSAIEYALLHCSEAQIPPRALPAAIRQGHCLLADEVVGQPLLTLAELEHQAILRAARASKGQVSQMARQLGQHVLVVLAQAQGHGHAVMIPPWYQCVSSFRPAHARCGTASPRVRRPRARRSRPRRPASVVRRLCPPGCRRSAPPRPQRRG